MNDMDFENLVIEMLYEKELTNPNEIRDFSDSLHQSIENAIQDYCYDEGIEDYDPCY